jgi:hypothetical protein
MAKKQNTQDLKKEARGKFERYIAQELLAQSDVGTDSLALNFYEKNEAILKKLARVLTIHQLVKWADDILNQSIAKETARNGQPQMALPMSLQGIELPGAYSFINGANKLRFVANYKAQKFHLESHGYILRKLMEGATSSVEQHTKLLDAVGPVMDDKTTLLQALQILAESELGAA